MPVDVVLAVDAGTTGVTVLAIDHDGDVVARGLADLYRSQSAEFPPESREV